MINSQFEFKTTMREFIERWRKLRRLNQYFTLTPLVLLQIFSTFKELGGLLIYSQLYYNISLN